MRELISRFRYAMVFLIGCLLGVYPGVPARAEGPYFATGIKIGEVSDQGAIVWTRLTKRSARNPSTAPVVKIVYDQPEAKGSGHRTRAVKKIEFPDGCTVSDLREAAPGADGDVRVLWKAMGDAEWQSTAWQGVDPLRDFTRQFVLSPLRSATPYVLRVESRALDGSAGAVEEGRFRTAPNASDPQRVVFVAATCFGNDDQDSPAGFKIYRAISALDPDFFVHTGDIVYYDELAKSVDLARWHWQRMYSWPSNVEFHRGIASYFMKDDHDTWYNDCWPSLSSRYMGEFTFRQGQAIFREQVPIGELPYRTFRWGRDLQVWLVEGRDFRSPNDQPDGPQKTVWGEEQIRWFEKSVEASDATFRVLISPTPLVGPDRNAKNDNLANRGFEREGGHLRDFVSAHRMLTVCGDRHWQFMSVDPRSKAREYSSGPGSDPHAGGWDEKDYRPDVHRFLRVAGGFLSMTIERTTNKPTLTARFHDVEGNVKFTDVVPAP